MSIIYDALKKVETKVEKPNDAALQFKINKGAKPNPYILPGFLLAAFLGFFAANYLFKLITPPGKNIQPAAAAPTKLPPAPAIAAPAPIATPTFAPIVTPAPAPIDVLKQGSPFMVSGIFYSENEAYAIINNRIVKEGDSLDGAKILKIQSDVVELNYEGGVIRLSAGSN